MIKKAAFLTLGCKVNLYETDAMQKLFIDAGYKIVGFSEDADVYVVNTCTVTNIADRKSRQMLRRAKKQHPEAIVVAAGCYVQTAALKDNAQELPVDLFIGNNMKSQIVAIVEKYSADSGKMEPHKEELWKEIQPHLFDLTKDVEYETLFIDSPGERTRASVKIQDGCNQFCSYCIIPYARGRIRSRNMDDVEREVRGLAAGGCKEIVLTGIHLSSYGADFAEDGKEKHWLLEMIKRLSFIQGVQRIRLGSLEPSIITEEFAEILSNNPKFCPHFHLSLQSGCNATLKRMNRHYTAQEYLEKCDILRRYFELPAITTDVITGFPGETEEEFLQCVETVRKAAFSQMHIFPFSKRQGTRAEHMPDQVPDPIKRQRTEKLIRLGQELQNDYQMMFIDKMQNVLFEERMDVDGLIYWTGHTERYIKVAVRDHGTALENQVTPVKILGCLKGIGMVGNRIDNTRV